MSPAPHSFFGGEPVRRAEATVGSSWRAQAACRGMDPDLFYADRGDNATEAKRICAGCPVRAECLEWALIAGETKGCWGGTTDQDRRKIRRERRGEFLSPCGTRAAYQRHRDHGETPCAACVAASREYKAQIRRGRKAS